MTQPEALRLAERLAVYLPKPQDMIDAAAELRRLHAELERCKQVCSAASESSDAVYKAITALRASLAQQMAEAGFTRRPSLWALQAREALELIAAPQRPDGTWNRDRKACRQLAAKALGRYDDD